MQDNTWTDQMATWAQSRAEWANVVYVAKLIAEEMGFDRAYDYYDEGGEG